MRFLRLTAAFLVLILARGSLASASTVPRDRAETRRAIRQATRAAAESDRPGEVKRVGNVDLFKQKPQVVGCTRRHAAASAFYTSAPRQGVFFLCKIQGGPWVVYEGPLYGE